MKTHVAISREIFKKTVAGIIVKFYEHLQKVGFRVMTISIQGGVNDMARIINVLIAIDSDTILQKYGKNTDPNNPKQIASNLIYMITEEDNAMKGQAGEELKIKGTPGDTIRWRETTLSLDPNTDVLLYKFVTSGALASKLFSTPKPVTHDIIIALPDEDNPLKPITKQITTHYWTSDLLKVGDVTYHFNFIILDAQGEVQGYYRLTIHIMVLHFNSVLR